MSVRNSPSLQGGYLQIECPVCGPPSKAEVLAAAYAGGWCVGSLLPQDPKHHKPRQYQVVGQVDKLGQKAHAAPTCQGCGAEFPKRKGPGRYPKLCEDCKQVAA